VLGPFDYQRPAPTGNLWFVEGVTDYFASHILYQSGLLSQAQLIDEFTAQVTQLQISRARRDATLEVASREIWNSTTDGFKDLSIYNKGYLGGLLLDCIIRSSTQGRAKLLTMMEELYARCVASASGFSEDELRRAVNRQAGTDCTSSYSAITRSTSELPYGLLSDIGLRVILAGNFYEDASGARYQANDFRIEPDPHASITAKMLRDDYFRRP
jgi:predicted metalloprotease with PDZ domain